MLNIRTSTNTDIALHTDDIAVSINFCSEVTTCGIAEEWLIGINEIPVRAGKVVALVFEC